ncbi:MAG: hypothetical protein WCP73_01315, partial [Eubacteriales bacterium]
ETETALLITTAFMALGSVTLSALSMAFQRSHSRKSVRPFCNVFNDSTDSEISVSIQNAGLGPMLIQKVVLLKNQDDPIEKGIQLAEFFSEGNCDVLIQNTNAYVLASLFKIKLFRCTAGINDHSSMPLLRNKLNGCTLYVKYADVYDDMYEKKETLIF